MKLACARCKKRKTGPLKLHSYRKKVGKRNKNVVEYYCKGCFDVVETERSWDEHRKKETILKTQNIKRLQRRQHKVR